MINILKKYNVSSISQMILNIFPCKTNLSQKQIKMIYEIKDDSPHIFSASKMNKISSVGACFSFCINEFFDFVNHQFSDGVTMFQVKMAFNDSDLIEEQLNIYNKHLLKYK